VPSTAEGTLTEILFKENDVVPIGTVIARIDTGGASQPATPNKEVATKQEPVGQKQADQTVEEVPYAPSAPAAAVKAGSNRFYSPLVLNIANSEGIGMAELENIPGTGNEGRVSKKDILQYIADKKNGKQPLPEPRSGAGATSNLQPLPEPRSGAGATSNLQPASYPSGNVEIIEMDRMRKLIAKHMVDSKQTAPHVTSFTEADVTNMVLWREKVKKTFEKQEGTKITFTPLFIECIVRVIKRFPLINSSVDGDRIIVKKDINIGMATALPSGNLIVPVIKNADMLNLVGLSRSVNGLADSARNNRLKPDDTQGGTFTLTNVGTFGSLMGTPIINQPQVAIMAVGAIKKRPVVIETPQGDTIGIRHMMYLSMSYDHRIVDGSLGASFLSEVAKEFEKWNPERNW
jgi:2-oxoglutarate dehydrogenase E2 component (dihydrolipoamide succinyltransferase)